jgi:hypothetical protein
MVVSGAENDISIVEVLEAMVEMMLQRKNHEGDLR